MSALPVPSNPLYAQPPAPSQSSGANNAPENGDGAFSSVLQQKVQAGNSEERNQANKAKGSSSANNANNANSSNNATKSGEASASQNATAANRADQDKAKADSDSKTPSALDIAKGDAPQTALQQLLPLLQGLQGKAKIDAKDTAKADVDALPQAAAINPSQDALPLQIDDKSAGGKGKGSALDAKSELAARATQDGTSKAEAAANLAAKEAAAGDVGKKDGAFDIALDKASAQANAQAAAVNHHSSAVTGSAGGGEATRMQAQLGTPQWQNELGDRVQFMSRNNESRAELVLNPPQLGRIEVSLNISGDHASAMFASANPEVRAALEGAMDRLREVLANNGISLGQTHVGADTSGQWSNGEQTGAQRGDGSGNGAMTGATTDASSGGSWVRHNNNMLDVFA